MASDSIAKPFSRSAQGTIRIGECPMIRSAFAVAAASIAASISFSSPIFGQEETDQRLGTVHFDTSCNEVAQRRFDRAMRYQHSFWYRESKDLFEEVLKADPDCGIAYWGIALSLLNNPHAPPPVGNLPLGLAAIEKGRAIDAKTQRERDFVNALAAFYTDFDKVDHRTRVLAYLKAMEGVAQAYPNDDEAQILYAIELNVAAPPNDKTYAMQLKGAAILEPIFLRQPRHPGVAHYLIHLYDTPALAERGLDAAKRYSQIAPAAPHQRVQRGALGSTGRRKGRHRQTRRTARKAARGQGRVLGRAGRHPVAGRDRLGLVCRGQVRRRAQGHERRRRCRGQDREASRDSGRADAGARTLWHDAARTRHGQGSARRVRSDVEKGAEPA